MRRLVLLVVAACSANKDAPPPAAGSDDPRTAVRPKYTKDAESVATIAIDAPPIDAPPSPEALAWNARWIAATGHVHSKPAANPDWPCATEGVSTGTTTFAYAGPAKCTVPPDEVQIGCPTKITALARVGGSPTTKTLYYDAKGFLVGAKLERDGGFVQRALFTYDGDQAVAGELDATGDGNLESRTKYERAGKTVRWSVDFGLSGKYGKPTVFVLADGRVQSQTTDNTITEFRWRGARLVERQYKIDGEDSSKTTYRYGCPN